MPMPTLQFEDVAADAEIPSIARGPLTSAHVMRWSAAMENWAPIHYDWRYATQHDKLPDILVNGSWKQHVLMQALNDWIGETGWLWKINFQYRGMSVPGDTLDGMGPGDRQEPARRLRRGRPRYRHARPEGRRDRARQGIGGAAAARRQAGAVSLRPTSARVRGPAA